MSVLTIKTAEVFEPLLHPARYKGAWGGRGSGKSHFYAELMCETALMQRGFRGVGIRETQKSIAQSSKRLIEDKIAEHNLEAQGFKIFKDVIQTPGDGLILFQGMQDHTAESIKSLEGIDVAWIEEAQTLSQRSLTLLRPTIRSEGSEIWASWNPRRKIDPIDVFLRQQEHSDAVVVRANWRDNPWFPAVLEKERQDDLRNNPDGYDHIWEGDYITVVDGAYFAKQLRLAREQGRITRLAPEPMMTVRTYHDLAGSSDKADAYSIWVCQFVGREIRALSYYETVGQSPEMHINWVRDWCLDRGFTRCQINLPHDGAQTKIENTWEDYWNRASSDAVKFDVNVIRNQGKGAAMKRVESARGVFPKIWFDEEGTLAGREALGWYHEKKDEERNVGLGPDHDWSSHGADAFGMMCMDYEEPRVVDAKRPRRRSGDGTWMGSA